MSIIIHALGYGALAVNLLVIWIVFWNVRAWPKVRKSEGPAVADRISVLIPARNEVLRLGACLESLVAQDAIVGEILVYDDHSTDGTAALVHDWALRDGRIRLIPPAPLEADWLGKPFACAQLADAARYEWLLFLDADTRIRSGAAAAMLQAAIARKATLLSCWPDLTMDSFWERMLMPLMHFFLFSLYPAPLGLKYDFPELGIAHGACILAQRDAYRRTGGHHMVKDEIVEDVLLARRWRASAEKGIFLDGTELIQLRMYASLGEIWQGFQKNFYPGFRHAASFWAFLILHGIAFLVPFLMAPAAFLGAAHLWPFWAAAACTLISRWTLAARFRQPFWPVLLHPLAQAMLIALGISSWWRCVTGQGVQWKDRTYLAAEKGNQE